jgi:isoquinoline 1-oxidoreductase beta subunit
MSMDYATDKGGLTRRRLLIGGGIGAGLLVAWQLLPRQYQDNLPINKGEHGFGSWLKIGDDGRVTVAIPQSEMGQGVYTILAQIVAGELGAHWRTVSVQPALENPIFANTLVAREWRGAFVDDAFDPYALGKLGDSIDAELARRDSFSITAGSSSLRMFETACREAGAVARTALCQAAAARWDTQWENCDTAAGFVVWGKKKLAFAELAAEASKFSPPDPIPLNPSPVNALSGQEVARIDVPAKLDGSANFAGDIRLPDMLYASVRAGPIGDTRLKKFNRKAGQAIKGVVKVIAHEKWLAAVGTNWWAANRALDAMAPIFETSGAMPSSAEISEKLESAFKSGKGKRIHAAGSIAGSFDKSAATRIFHSVYHVAPAVHAPLETRSATAQFSNGRLTLWIATQSPAACRRAAAAAIGISENAVTIIPMFAGGSFGRNLDNDIAGQVAYLAMKTEQPVQLIWSRAEDFVRDKVRTPAQAKISGAIDPAGLIKGLSVRMAVPATGREQARRLQGDTPTQALAAVKGEVDMLAAEGIVPLYGIPNIAIDIFPADLPLPTGRWRGNAHSYTAFFIESFIDEMAQAAGVEPMSYRMQMLSGQVRLARCLTGVAALAGWDGGASGSGKGIACHAMHGGYIALIASARTGEEGVRVDRISAMVDIGRIVHPEIARQQIEGGIVFGLAQALGGATEYHGGMPSVRRLREIDLPVLADVPEIEIEFIRSDAQPAGYGELGVPAVAPAIANALFSASGVRLRELPLLSRGL